MTLRTIPAAVLLGVGVLVLGQILYFVDWLTPGPQTFLYEFLSLFPAIASLCSTLFAPGRKLSVGLSMALFGPITAMIALYVYQQLGMPTDKIGGLATTFGVLFVYHTVLCSVGTGVGYGMSKWPKRWRG